MKIGPCQNLWIIWDGFPFPLPNCSTGTDELTVAVLMMEWNYGEDTNKPFLVMDSFTLLYPSFEFTQSVVALSQCLALDAFFKFAFGLPIRAYPDSPLPSFPCSGVYFPSLASLLSQRVRESERAFTYSTVGTGSQFG